MDKGIIITTPAGIAAFRLLSMRGRVSLESKGLKSRGFSARKMMALEMGLKPTAKYDAVIAAINAKLKELEPEAIKGIN
jgi:hypothetical protein